MSHTPGPWVHSPCHIEEGPDAVRAPDRSAVCFTSNSADARLIAAAPELLAAAKAAQCACSPMQRESGHVIGCWMPDLLDAIAKAEGK